MTILVTGANGQLGNEMRLISAGSQDKYIFTDVNQVEGVETEYLDITDPDAVRRMVTDYDVTVVVNCAAYTNVDAAETNQELAELLNAKAPENLALAMKEAGGLLVHVSTDYVFGGDPYNTPCREDQKGTPTGVYGLTKLHGEEKIIASGCDHVIIRTAWLYSEYGRNFCKTMMNLTATKPQLKVVFDQVGTPTYAGDLALVIKLIAESEFLQKQGIYHFSNEGAISWFDFAKAIIELNGNNCEIDACSSEDFGDSVSRPNYSVLDKTKIKQTLGLGIPYWKDSLKVCLSKINELYGEA